MRLRTKTLVGRISERGEIQAHWDALNEFLLMHKGSVAILRVEIQPKESSEKTKNYFFGYCIPEMQQAYQQEYGEWLSKEQTYDTLRSVCPLFLKEERVNGVWRKHLREFEELDQSEMNEVIEWLYHYAAENFYKILDYPQR